MPGNLKNILPVVFAPILILIPFAPSFAENGATGGSPLMGLLPFVLLFALFYFLIIRPQQKKSRQRERMLKNLKRGDNVLTNGGIYATITDIIDGETLTLEVAKGITVRASISGVASKIEEKAGG